MIKSLIYRLLERRHFWRYASFSEIAELYTSRTLTIIAMYIASGFGSVYIYQLGYSLQFIMIFWGLYYLLKMPLAFASALFAARFGPKHGILISNLLYIPAMVALGFVPEVGVTGIILWGIPMCLSASLYHVCYLIDFSKVKNVEHAGKEIAFMNIIEKIAVGVSPVIGGVIALYFGPQLVMWVAAGFFVIAALPLMRSAEQVHTHQKIKIRGFPWQMAWRSLLAQVGIGFDVIATAIVWGLFIAVVMFPGMGNEIYVTLGALSSVAIFAAIATSYAYGKLIDRRRGGDLLRISVIINSLVHVSRPFVATPLSIIGTNVANEVATAGVVMSYTRGLFDTADLSGHRIMYLCFIEAVANFGAVLGCAVAILCLSLLGSNDGMRAFFFVAAAFVLLTGTAHFQLYRK